MSELLFDATETVSKRTQYGPQSEFIYIATRLVATQPFNFTSLSAKARPT